jgi:hypothetical protein
MAAERRRAAAYMRLADLERHLRCQKMRSARKGFARCGISAAGLNSGIWKHGRAAYGMTRVPLSFRRVRCTAWCSCYGCGGGCQRDGYLDA